MLYISWSFFFSSFAVDAFLCSVLFVNHQHHQQQTATQIHQRLPYCAKDLAAITKTQSYQYLNLRSLRCCKNPESTTTARYELDIAGHYTRLGCHQEKSWLLSAQHEKHRINYRRTGGICSCRAMYNASLAHRRCYYILTDYSCVMVRKRNREDSPNAPPHTQQRHSRMSDATASFDDDMEKGGPSIVARILTYGLWKDERKDCTPTSSDLSKDDGHSSAAVVTTSEWEQKTCVFCLEDIRNDDLVRSIGCSHAFHDACASQWRPGKKQRCPLCRTTYIREPATMASCE